MSTVRPFLAPTARFERDGPPVQQATYLFGMVTHVRALALLAIGNDESGRWGFQVGGDLHMMLSLPFRTAPITVGPTLGARGRF